MTRIDSSDEQKRYTLRAVSTPLPSQSAKKPQDADKPATADAQLRPANEDDDGYDPYSDYKPRQEFFIEDPWR